MCVCLCVCACDYLSLGAETSPFFDRKDIGAAVVGQVLPVEHGHVGVSVWVGARCVCCIFACVQACL